MLALAKEAPARALYFVRSANLAEDGKIHPAPPALWRGNWRDLDVIQFADECSVLFPGQIFSVAEAQAVGGFCRISYLTGDWDMWFRLALRFGAAQTAMEVSINRSHFGMDRGTSRVERMGWKWALDNVQRKRNLARLRKEKGIVIPFDRAKLLTRSPISSRMLLRYACGYSRRILFYNWWLFTHSRPPHASYAVLQWLVRLLGPHTLRAGSVFLNRRKRLDSRPSSV
jgi:hypothetical protein